MVGIGTLEPHAASSYQHVFGSTRLSKVALHRLTVLWYRTLLGRWLETLADVDVTLDHRYCNFQPGVKVDVQRTELLLSINTCATEKQEAVCD